jgi:hypothetical protein
MIAALYVEKDGIYYGLPEVDPWDEERDARLYDGPWPVVAHPPCKSWSLMGNCRPETRAEGDGGTFQAALEAVEKFGGVLEHPAHSKAWRTFNLPKPARPGWNIALHGRPGWATEVDQAAYGHPANKKTWLYYVGPPPPPMLWGRAPDTGRTVRNDGGGGRDQRSITPRAFALELIRLARLSQTATASVAPKDGSA